MSSKPTYRCPACAQFVEPILDKGHDVLVSYCCDEVVERVWMCETCNEREAHGGCDDCIECTADEFVAAPADFIGTDKLKAEIADELAKRLKPFLRQRQAA